MIKVGQIYKIKDNYLVVKAISKKGTKLIVRHSFRNKDMVISASAILQAKKVAYFKNFHDAVSCKKWIDIVTKNNPSESKEKSTITIKRLPPPNYFEEDKSVKRTSKVQKEIDDFLEPRHKRKNMHKDLLTNFLESFE